MPSGLNLVVTAVLHDSLCVVLLLPYVADCTVCKVERVVLTIIKWRLLLLLSRVDAFMRLLVFEDDI